MKSSLVRSLSMAAPKAARRNCAAASADARIRAPASATSTNPGSHRCARCVKQLWLSCVGVKRGRGSWRRCGNAPFAGGLNLLAAGSSVPARSLARLAGPRSRLTLRPGFFELGITVDNSGRTARWRKSVSSGRARQSTTMFVRHTGSSAKSGLRPPTKLMACRRAPRRQQTNAKKRVRSARQAMADSFVFQVDWTVVVIIIFLLALVLVNFVYRRRNRD
jgi:hypothetical protein